MTSQSQSNGYYNDERKLTFDEADMYVERFIREYSQKISHVKSKHIMNAYGIEDMHHNVVRIGTALDNNLEVEILSGTKQTVYKVKR